MYRFYNHIRDKRTTFNYTIESTVSYGQNVTAEYPMGSICAFDNIKRISGDELTARRKRDVKSTVTL